MGRAKTVVDNENKSDGLSPLQPQRDVFISNVSQRPRRKIQHKYIKFSKTTAINDNCAVSTTKKSTPKNTVCNKIQQSDINNMNMTPSTDSIFPTDNSSDLVLNPFCEVNECNLNVIEDNYNNKTEEISNSETQQKCCEVVLKRNSILEMHINKGKVKPSFYITQQNLDKMRKKRGRPSKKLHNIETATQVVESEEICKMITDTHRTSLQEQYNNIGLDNIVLNESQNPIKNVDHDCSEKAEIDTKRESNILETISQNEIMNINAEQQLKSSCSVVNCDLVENEPFVGFGTFVKNKEVQTPNITMEYGNQSKHLINSDISEFPVKDFDYYVKSSKDFVADNTSEEIRPSPTKHPFELDVKLEIADNNLRTGCEVNIDIKQSTNDIRWNAIANISQNVISKQDVNMKKDHPKIEFINNTEGDKDLSTERNIAINSIKNYIANTCEITKLENKDSVDKIIDNKNLEKLVASKNCFIYQQSDEYMENEYISKKCIERICSPKNINRSYTYNFPNDHYYIKNGEQGILHPTISSLKKWQSLTNISSDMNLTVCKTYSLQKLSGTTNKFVSLVNLNSKNKLSVYDNIGHLEYSQIKELSKKIKRQKRNKRSKTHGDTRNQTKSKKKSDKRMKKEEKHAKKRKEFLRSLFYHVKSKNLQELKQILQNENLRLSLATQKHNEQQVLPTQENPSLEISNFTNLEREYENFCNQVQDTNTEFHSENSYSTFTDYKVTENSNMKIEAFKNSIETKERRRSGRIKFNEEKKQQEKGNGLVYLKQPFSSEMQFNFILPVKTEEDLEKERLDRDEALSLFDQISDNVHKTEGLVNTDDKDMICDCFLTKSELERGEMGCGEDCLNRMLLIECGPNCGVKTRCTNKRFQQHLDAPCDVFKTEKKGYGLKAKSFIPDGEFIMEYVGEILDGDEFDKRAEEYANDKNRHHYFMALSSNCVIDATIKGNISRFINHSCDPNSETQKWTINGELRIGFFTTKPILPEEEITFDYQFQRFGKQAQKCYCEAEICTGWIGGEPDADLSVSSSEEDEGEEVERVIDSNSNLNPETNSSALKITEQIHGASSGINQELISKIQNNELNQDISSTGSLLEVESSVIHKKKEKKIKHLKIQKHDRIEMMEDPELDKEIEALNLTKLKNQVHTLKFSRLVVRARLQKAKVKLLEILRESEIPCRRLFLDYHGLKLLYSWMINIESSNISELEFKMEILLTLKMIPIPDKTMLCESKVMACVKQWTTDSDSTNNYKMDEVGNEQVSKLLHSISEIGNKLIDTWEELPAPFKIPKKMRIEQMKEHEREADRSCRALGLPTGDDDDISKHKKSRHDIRRNYSSSKEKRRFGGDNESNVDKTQRRLLFEARVAHSRRRAEDDLSHKGLCSFFWLDHTSTSPLLVPCYVDTQTGQWFNYNDQIIPTPPSHAHIHPPPLPPSRNPDDYILPDIELPEGWAFALDNQGRIYYYHRKIRIPQWEPPIKLLPLLGECCDKSEAFVEENDTDSAFIVNDVAKYDNTIVENKCEESDTLDEKENMKTIKGTFENVTDDDSTCEYELEQKINFVQNILKTRKVPQGIVNMFQKPLNLAEEISALAGSQNSYSSNIANEIDDLNRIISMEIKLHGAVPDKLQRMVDLLVQERPMSPRTEEEIRAMKVEMKRYKVNKEKLRQKRLECKQKRTREKEQTLTIPLHFSDSSSPTTELCKTNSKTVISEDQVDDEADRYIDNFSLGIVDELDALKTCKVNDKKVSNPIHKRKITANNIFVQTKKSKQINSLKTNEINSARKVRDKFRTDIAGVIVNHLGPYRKDNCMLGRITNNEDFKHLARKLTHFVMVKELKHCDNTVNVLEVTDSVKIKSREFIKKYMSKFGEVYVRGENEPDYKE